jgi:hypothetical protein
MGGFVHGLNLLKVVNCYLSASYENLEYERAVNRILNFKNKALIELKYT